MARNRLFRLLVFAAMLVVFPCLSSATIINFTMTSDTPDQMTGYFDWETPVAVSSPIILGTNWFATAIEVPTGANTGLLVLLVQHLVSPHAPPTVVPGLLTSLFFPAAPGFSSPTVTDITVHADDPDHVDRLSTWVEATSSSMSRVHFEATHGPFPDDVTIPEPGTNATVVAGLFMFGAALFKRSR